MPCAAGPGGTQCRVSGPGWWACPDSPSPSSAEREGRHSAGHCGQPGVGGARGGARDWVTHLHIYVYMHMYMYMYEKMSNVNVHVHVHVHVHASMYMYSVYMYTVHVITRTYMYYTVEPLYSDHSVKQPPHYSHLHAHDHVHVHEHIHVHVHVGHL